VLTLDASSQAWLSFIVQPTLTLAVTARETVRTAGKPT
jgi:hypothetical protein